MSCHFQLSLAKADERQAGDPSCETYVARLRRDGEQWKYEPLEDEEGNSFGMLCSPETVEDIQKFPLPGPPGLLEETALGQIGWCVSHVDALHQALTQMEAGDRLSFNGGELSSGNWKALIKEAIKVSATLAQREILDARTQATTLISPRPRF